MTAYGAVISLKNTIEYILHSSHISLVDEPSIQIIQLAYKELQPLQDILERLDSTRTSRSRKQVNALDGRIKQKIWEFEDLLESLLYQQVLPQFPVDGDGGGGIKETTTVWKFHIPSKQFQFQLRTRRRRRRRRVVHKHKSRRRPTRRSRDPLLFSIDVQSLQDDVASFIHALKDMEKEYIYELENMPREPISARVGFDFGGPESKMIGFSDQFERCKVNLMLRYWEDYEKTYLHHIVGMAGIGKTTLAKELYVDAEIVNHFDCRAWVTVTRTMVDEGPQFDEIVKGIVAKLCRDTLIQGGDEKIGDYLKGKKCLIVLDDVWEEQVVRCLRKSLHDMKNGLYYILVTTRGINLFGDENTEVPFLSEEESKDLLCEKVFGDQRLCPDQLDKAATKIAKKCEGLPLMIVTVADILSKSQNTEPEYWNDVAEERNSVFTDAYNEISKVLYPSYDYLPQYLKMPFLYLGVFPPDYQTPQSKHINMLNAEGWFLDTNKKESLTESVWACLNQLCQYRYLVLFKRQSVYWFRLALDSIYKTCWLHSSWRYVCREEARKNKFYHVLNRLVDAEEEEVIKGHRCLCLQNNILFGIKEFYNSLRLNCASFTRSVLFLGPYHQYPTPIDVGFRLLRELDTLQLRFYTFPTEILTLVQLKYLALTYNGELPTTISKLFNLQVLIVHPHMSIKYCRAPSYVPTQIWDMKELEHIEILGKSLRVPNHIASLEKLSTLIGVNASISTILALSRRIPNIRKLNVRVELMPNNDHNNLLSCFACISKLESLEILKCSIINPVIQYGHIGPAPPSSLKFPHKLRKLHLSGMGFPWEYMDVIGSLPDLQVLKLRSYAFRGSNWEVAEGSFMSLEFLLIEDSDLVQWKPRYRSFEKLSYLSMKHCYKLVEIQWPSHSALGKIELVDCNPLAVTCAIHLQLRQRTHLHITASSHFDKKPTTIKLESYGVEDPSQLDTIFSTPAEPERSDITMFSSYMFIFSMILLLGCLLKSIILGSGLFFLILWVILSCISS